MKVAALYDIHGNLPALDAVLADVERASADMILVGGDVVLGPMPHETLERVRRIGPSARFIRGNCDRLVVDAYDGRPLPPLPEAVRQSIEWTARQLDVDERDFLDSFQQTTSLRIGAFGEVLFCHATPRSDEEIVTRMTSLEAIRPMLAGVTATLVVCGHTHMQFDRSVDAIRIVNAGSVGMPYGPPGAYWLMLDETVDLKRTEYDLEQAAHAIALSGYPGAHSFAAHSVLSPPTEEAVLATFGRAV